MGKVAPSRAGRRYDIPMRSRILFFTLLLAVGTFALPLAAHAAAIPFFGPIVPNNCPAGWGLLVEVINNIIRVLLTIAIVFFAPLMIAYAGFLFVVNPVNAGGREQAKQILTNTIVGIIISLSAWMIVGAIMAALYHPESTGWGTWQELMVGGGSAGDCLVQPGNSASAPSTPSVPGVTVACTISPLSPIIDRLAQQMEAMNGNAVIWERTDPRLQKCANKFIGKLKAGGETKAYVSSAYRPQAYQTHLWEIHDRWCTQGLKSSTNTACYQLKSDVLQEVVTHFRSNWSCGAVGATSRHTTGTGVDIAGIVNPGNLFQRDAARESCLDWKNYPDDPVHYDLMISCTCE